MNTSADYRNDDARLDDADRAIVATARDFAREHVAPHAAAWEHERRMPADALRRAAEAGLCGLFVARDLGGLGAGRRAVARVLEELAGECMAFAFSLVVHNNLTGNIAANGNDDQKARYLPPMLSGERIGAFSLTEPGAGSDAAGITTAAWRDGDGWVIEGEKAWVTNGNTAEILSAYVQTDASAGWRGIACVMVDAEAPGVERLPAYPLLGTHGLGTNGFRSLAAGSRMQMCYWLPATASKRP